MAHSVIKTSTIRAITFDITNTLVQVRGSVGANYRLVDKEYGLLHGVSSCLIDQSFLASFKYHWKRYPNFGYGLMQSYEWWECVTKKTVSDIRHENALQSSTELLNAFSATLYHHFSSSKAYEVLPGGEEVLKHLRRYGFPMGVITNNDHRIKRVIDDFFPEGTFKYVLVSNDEGSAKPSVDMFMKAQVLSNVDFKDMLHIGDSFDKDYIPAKSLGMQAIVCSKKPDKHVPDQDFIRYLPDMLKYFK